VAASVALAACGSDAGTTAPQAAAATTNAPGAPTSAGSATSAAPAATPTGAPTTIVAPSSLQFTADLVAGGKVDFRQYAGQTLALWFWAPT
jgi:hypothetical protein